MSEPTPEARIERIALGAVVAGALLAFPLALGLGAAALLRLPRGNAYRRVAAAGFGLGVAEILAFAAALGFVLLHDPFPARERAAVDQLRKIRAAQVRFRAEARADRDGDGRGEFGSLPELASEPPLVSTVFRTAAPDGTVEKFGYHFQVFFPRRRWDDASSGPPESPDDVDGRETAWIAYAWPAVNEGTATGVFAADRLGVYRASNAVARFDGLARRPRAASALTGFGAGDGVALDGPSLDGETWVRVD